jgi:hypothetical protein
MGVPLWIFCLNLCVNELLLAYRDVFYFIIEVYLMGIYLQRILLKVLS